MGGQHAGTALTIECTGCGAEIITGNAFINEQGWFHNEVCVRSYWQSIGYVPGSRPPSREPHLRALSFGKVIEWLEAAVTDWDGSRMKDGEPPRPIMTCRDVRELSAFIERLERERRGNAARKALGEAVEWADRHGKEPDWLEDARAALKEKP